jgi:hypothetical protein
LQSNTKLKRADLEMVSIEQLMLSERLAVADENCAVPFTDRHASRAQLAFRAPTDEKRGREDGNHLALLFAS